MPWTMTRAEKKYDEAAKKAFCDKHGRKKAKWRPGKYKGPRQTTEYCNWRKAVLKRDGKVCRKCGETNGVLHVHHVMSFYHNPELRYDIENGEVWCAMCHNTYHS